MRVEGPPLASAADLTSPRPVKAIERKLSCPNSTQGEFPAEFVNLGPHSCKSTAAYNDPRMDSTPSERYTYIDR